MKDARFSTRIELPFDVGVRWFEANAVAPGFFAMEIKHPDGEVCLFFDEDAFAEFQCVVLLNAQPTLGPTLSAVEDGQHAAC